MSTKRKASAPKLTAAEIRAEIGDAKKQVVSARIIRSRIAGTASDLSDLFNSEAKLAGLTGEWRIEWRNAESRSYSYRRGYYGQNNPDGYVLVGLRDYTDEELVEGGKGLVTRIKKAQAAAQKKRERDLAKLSEMARKLGVDVSA